MPLLRTDTGCRCRKTLVSITTTRLRRSRGAGWRKILFQTCELRMKSPMAIADPYEAVFSEDINPKYEIRNTKQIQNPKFKGPKRQALGFRSFAFFLSYLDLFRIS